MNDQSLRDYADIKNKIKLLESQLDELKPIVMDMVLDGEQKSLSTDFGTFIVKERRTFEYPEEIRAKEIELKALKDVYELSEDAILKNVSSSLTYVPNKGKAE